MVKLIADSGERGLQGVETLLDIDLRIADMDRQEIGRQVLTLWTDIFGYELPAAKGAKWHGLLNDCLARLCEGRPERFSWMASGPLQDAGLAARALARCLKAGAVVLRHDGKSFDAASIGSAIATRAIMEDLRAGMDGPLGAAGGGPPPFSKADRSRFLQALDRVLVGMG